MENVKVSVGSVLHHFCNFSAPFQVTQHSVMENQHKSFASCFDVISEASFATRNISLKMYSFEELKSNQTWSLFSRHNFPVCFRRVWGDARILNLFSEDSITCWLSSESGITASSEQFKIFQFPFLCRNAEHWLLLCTSTLTECDTETIAVVIKDCRGIN